METMRSAQREGSCRRLVSLALFVLAGWIGAATDASAAVTVTGTVYDGVQGAQKLLGQQSDYKVPMADTDVDIMIGAVRAAAWTVKTDASGAFTVDVDVATLPADALVVARCAAPDGKGGPWYSGARTAVAGKPVELYVYPLVEAKDDVQVDLAVVHDIQTVGEEKLLRVRCRVSVWSARGLFVGTGGADGRREVFRLPLPQAARIVKRSGPESGMRWRRSESGDAMIIDEPIPGFPDLIADMNASKSWYLEYLVEPSQLFTLTYDFNIRSLDPQRGGFRVYLPDSIKIEGKLFQSAGRVDRDPVTREQKHYSVFAPRQLVQAGQSRMLPLSIENGAIGQISRKALFWHGGTLLVCLVATLLGSALGLFRFLRRPPSEAVLDGLTTEEVLDRIADLDARHKRGEISEADYERYRAPLVEIAAEELEAAVAPVAGATQDTSALAPEARDLVDRIGELDASGAGTPADIQTRAHMLEALYKALAKKADG